MILQLFLMIWHFSLLEFYNTCIAFLWSLSNVRILHAYNDGDIPASKLRLSKMYFYLTSLSKDVFISASTHIFISQHYSSSIDLSNMYNPSTITCSIAAVSFISFSMGSLTAWSKDGKNIGKFFLYFTSFILSLNFSRSKV